jgi:nuclear transport factor 2 (NTF2) superfamily protein
MERRDASINDVKIQAEERRYFRNEQTGLVEYPHGHP